MKHAIGRLLAMIALAAQALPGQGALVAGIPLPDALPAPGMRLALNGAGVRHYYGFRVYVAALYLPAATRHAERVLASDTPRRLRLTLLRDLSTQRHADALLDGMRDNHSAEEMSALKPELERCLAMLRDLRDIAAGAVIDFDYQPGSGTAIILDGRLLGHIAGERFNRALLRIWLGDAPIEAALKRALLGIEAPRDDLTGL